MLPEGWKTTILSELADRIGDGLHGTPVYDDSGAYYFINGNNIKNGYLCLDENTKKVGADEYLKHKKELTLNTLFLSINGTIGNIAFYRDEKVVLGKSAAYINLNKKVSLGYIYYLLGGPIVKAYFEAELTGSTIRNLSLKTIRNTPILLPSLPEQQKIAKIISTWDEAIEKLGNLIERKKKRKSGLLETLFEDIRSKHKSATLESIAEILPSNVDKKTNIGETEVRLCNYVDVYKNNKITNKIEFMVASASQQEIQKFKIFKDDLIITKDSETAKDIAIPSYVAEDIENLVCGYHLTLVRPDSKKLLGHFLYYYFLTERSKYYFYTMANGAIRFGLSVDAFKEASIPLPNLDIQEKIVRVLNECEEEIESTICLINLLETQKQGLMQQLLTGKKRVTV